MPEPTKIPMTIIHLGDGWYAVNAETSETISGPYTDHADAVQAIQTHAHRLAQGWAI